MNHNTPTLLHEQPLPHDPLSEMLRQGARHLIAQAVEAELEEILSQHQHRREANGRRSVVRNGYLPERELLTGLGPVSVRVPKLRSRDPEQPVVFRSSLVPPYVRRSKSLEATLPWLYLKGISSGQLGEALKALLGSAAKGLSPGVLSRLKRQWQQEDHRWRRRPLSQQRWVYLWVDGIYSKLRGSDGQRLCVLVVIGVNEHGEKHFPAIEDGVRESTQSWREVFLGLKRRGLKPPRLVIADGAMGAWKALEEVYAATRGQRCWVHKTANVLNALPKRAQAKAKQSLHQICMAQNRRRAHEAFDPFVQCYQAKYPKATACLEKDREALLCFYDFPAEHWIHIRTTNPVESAFATIRHRTRQSRGCVSRETMLAMMYKLGQCAEKRGRRLRGFASLGKLLAGVEFRGGVEVGASSQPMRESSPTTFSL